MLQQSFDGTVLPSITQTGTIPFTAKSLRFFSSSRVGEIGVAFAGRQHGITLIGGIGDPYYIWATDVSQVAGQTDGLKFWGNGVNSNLRLVALDAIYFSPLPVPVPLNVSQTGTNTLLLSWQSYSNAFYVQASSDLIGTNWLTLTNLPVTGQYPCTATVLIPKGPTFYRLISQ